MFSFKRAEVIKKCKGVLSNSLNLEDFKDMYYSSKNVTALKTNSVDSLSSNSSNSTVTPQSANFVKSSLNAQAEIFTPRNSDSPHRLLTSVDHKVVNMVDPETGLRTSYASRKLVHSWDRF